MAVSISLPLFAQGRGVSIPDMKGYVTLKCDFHIHTVFSHDGTVWPTVRVDEAYREGLDVISLTDHIEGWKFKEGIDTSRNRPHEIAQALAESRGIILIKGGEIAFRMPVGDHNALFVTNGNDLYKRDYMEAYGAAKAQKAFLFWCHPGVLYQQPDSTMWWPVHTQMFENGMMHGVEVFNGVYYPEAHQWCLDKKLTMLGNSDVHGPMQIFAPGKHRTLTLVFAKERSEEAIREALFDRRTAVYHDDWVIGEEKYLKELFENALEWNIVKTDKKEEVLVTVKNKSDLAFRLKKTNHDPRVIYFRNTSIAPFTITPKGTHSFTVRLLENLQSGDVNFIVENFLAQPNEGMKYTLKVRN